MRRSERLARRPRFHVHFTPTYSSGLNQVERWFALITNQAIRRSSVDSVADPRRKIDTFVTHYNQRPAVQLDCLRQLDPREARAHVQSY
jgi:transposase